MTTGTIGRSPRWTRRVLGAVLAVAAAATLWTLASRTQSPDQVSARAKPPPIGDIVAPIRTGRAFDPIRINATAVPRQTATVTASTAPVGAVLTRVPTPAGSEIRSGTPIAVANDRPIIALAGSFPFYRDLSRGDRGPDVEQLQAALLSAGFSTAGDTVGTFGTATQEAMERVYRTSGFAVPPPLQADLDAVAALRAQIAAPPEGADIAGLRAQLAAALPATETRFVRAEFVAISGLPGTIASTAPVGTVLAADTQLAKVDFGGAVLTATISPGAEASAIEIGATGSAVRVDLDEPPISIVVTNKAPSTATTSATGATPSETDGGAATGSTGTEMMIDASGPLALGSSCTVDFDTDRAETSSSPGLIVPLPAVYQRRGESLVALAVGATTFEEIEVSVISTSGAVAQIESTDTRIKAGAKVRISDG